MAKIAVIDSWGFKSSQPIIDYCMSYRHVEYSYCAMCHKHHPPIGDILGFFANHQNQTAHTGGTILVSGSQFLWWLTCPMCDAVMHGLADRKVMIIDPTCPNCLEMVAGITNPYLLIEQEELESEAR